MLKPGDIILVAHRRLFETDNARFFVGHVDEYEGGVVKVTGRSFVRDVLNGQVLEKAERRTKILSLSSGALITYQVPQDISLDALKFEDSGDGLSLTDGKTFTMNLSEHVHSGRL
jgi:hypothetical protein